MDKPVFIKNIKFNNILLNASDVYTSKDELVNLYNSLGGMVSKVVH